MLLLSSGMPFMVSLDLAAQDHVNFKAGSFSLDLIATSGVEYNDNINASGVRPLEDIILTAGVDVESDWQISQYNALSLDLGLSFAKYLKHSELDSSNSFLNLSPDTTLAFDVRVGSFDIQVYDNLGFSADPTDSIVVDPLTQEVEFEVLQYNRFSNTAGIDVNWDMNSLTKVNFGFKRHDIIPLDSQFDFTDRTDNVFSASVKRQLSSKLTVGAKGSITSTEYEDNFQNDSKGNSAGVSIEYSTQERISLALDVIWKTIDFSNNGNNSDNSDTSTINVDLSLRHRMNSSYSHVFRYSRTTDLGYISNSFNSDRVEYGFDWRLIRRMPFNGAISYEKNRDSGGLSPEQFDRFSFRLGTDFRLNSRLTGTIGYNYSNKQSDIELRSYSQNRLFVNFRYDF